MGERSELRNGYVDAHAPQPHQFASLPHPKSTPDHDFALIENSNGNTALQVSSFYDSSGTFVAALLASPKVKDTIDKKAPNGKAALHLAASHGVKDVVELLVKHGAKVDEASAKIAADKGHTEVAEFLQEKLKAGGEL